MLIDLTLEINPSNAENPIAKMGHFGTHLDIMDKNNQIPIENFFCNTTLIDITNIRNRIIETEDLLNYDIYREEFIIFRTNWMKDYKYGSQQYHNNHPHFSDNAIDFLISKKIRFIGLDFPGAQRKEKHHIIDKKCADHNIYIIENLNNLDLINKNRLFTYCFPMKLSGMTGIPIRVIAQI